MSKTPAGAVRAWLCAGLLALLCLAAQAPAVFDLPARKAEHWAWRPVRRPAVPAVRERGWVRNPIDAFVLAKLEASGMRPAPPADRYTLLRRVTFDVTGLPPTPAEIDAFIRDTAPGAYERVVDRLLASPHYGERWARHWLDLVRYGETDGHEFDYEKPGAYRYRDYVIRALNADLPYDQFVREHIAGDLLPHPRLNPADGSNESVIGTVFWWLGEASHSPVDVTQEQRNILDNQVDTFGKALLGLTLGCARCHDHKFDAVSTRDYYALTGYLKSSRYHLAEIDPPGRNRAALAELERVRREVDALGGPTMDHPVVLPAGALAFKEFAATGFAGWTASGEAFGDAPRSYLVIDKEHGRVARMGIPSADSGWLSDRLHGTLRSPTFTIEKPFILSLATGHGGAKLNVIIDGYQKIRDPIYGGLTIAPNDDRLLWRAQDVSKWIGHRAYVELIDYGAGRIACAALAFADRPDLPPAPVTSETHVDPARLEALLARKRATEARLIEPTRVMALEDGTGEDDHICIRGNHKTLGPEAPRRFLEACGGGGVPSSGSGRLALAERVVSPDDPLLARVIVNRLWQHHFGEGIVRTVDDFGVMGERSSHPELLDWLAAELVAPLPPEGGGYHAPAVAESALGPSRTPSLNSSPASGSRFNANHVSSPFRGQGGWSLKRLHRLIVTSSAYRMGGQADPAAPQLDPANRLQSHMPLRRLEAEAVRDAVLAVSGRLDGRLYGPSVTPYLTPFMEGRGKPDVSGPLDGGGRRSIYLGVRRNFLNPMFAAFDYPVPATCMGRRSVSNVPAQALTLMNDPFVVQQAAVWAKKLLATPGSDQQRLRAMWLAAFGRPATVREVETSRAFVAKQRARHPGDEPRVWADLCHVLLNVKEFEFVR